MSQETKAWVSAQVTLTAEQLKLTPDRDAFRDQLANNWNYPKFTAPTLRKDGYYYVRHNIGYVAPHPTARRGETGGEEQQRW